MLRRIHDPERGASILEYAAVMALVAAIAGVLFASGVAEAVRDGVNDSVALALGGEGAPGGGGDPGTGRPEPGRERGGGQGEPSGEEEVELAGSERGDRGGDPPRGTPKGVADGWSLTGGQVGDYYADLLWNHPRENLVGTIESVLDPLGTMDAMMDGVVDTAVTMRDEYAENRRAALDQLLSGDVLGGIGTYVGGSLRITVWDNPYNGLAIARGLWGSASEHVENGEYGRAAADVASEVLG